MRYLIYFSLFLLQLAFISCEKEEIIEDTPKETPYYLGYFEGAVNGQDISIRNKSASWRYIDAGFYSDRKHSSRYAMKVVLLPLQEGEYNIEKGIRTQEEITSYIRITDSLNKVEYCPLKKPFKVYVDSVRYHESSMMPYIEGKMEGTLYNRYDVNDSIVVKDAIFGIH